MFLLKCVVFSWYISVDMQLFIIAPFLLTQVQRNEKRFVVASIFLILIDFIALINGWALWYEIKHFYFICNQHEVN